MLWPFGQSSQLGLSLILNLRRTVLWPTTVSMRSFLFPTVLRVTLLCPPVHRGRGGAVNFFSFSSTCWFGDASLSPADHMYRCRYMGTFPRVGLWSRDSLMVFLWTNLFDKGVFRQKLARLKAEGQLLIAEMKEISQIVSQLLYIRQCLSQNHESSKDEPLLLCQSIFGYKGRCQLTVGQYL